MIYNVSILHGYTALRGTSLIHLPMLITQLSIVRIPAPDGVDCVFPEARYWYIYSAFMHLLLGLIHLGGFCKTKFSALYLDSVRILSVILQVLNFILMAQMWVKAPAELVDFNAEQAHFDYWLFVEATMIFGTITSNIIFLLLRSCERSKLEYNFTNEIDEEADFVSTIENQFLVNLFSIVWIPLVQILGA